MLLLVGIIGLSVFIYSIREDAARLAAYGYPGIFLLSFLAYATVLLPAPGLLIVFAMGSILNPVGVALAAGAGATLGEFSGYLAGFTGRAVIERSAKYERLSGWMKKNGPLTILVLSAIPNPVFDIAGMTAGVLKMPVPRFLLWCWIGETIKMLVLAYGGASSLRFLL
ncbi:MAG: hypothetical protein EHM70_07750 [Chloroflexota bacterium]|nr:MAG: hypothetical protein EHM70_07750 [Chloroflexota bacterium]